MPTASSSSFPSVGCSTSDRSPIDLDHEQSIAEHQTNPMWAGRTPTAPPAERQHISDDVKVLPLPVGFTSYNAVFVPIGTREQDLIEVPAQGAYLAHVRAHEAAMRPRPDIHPSLLQTPHPEIPRNEAASRQRPPDLQVDMQNAQSNVLLTAHTPDTDRASQQQQQNSEVDADEDDCGKFGFRDPPTPGIVDPGVSKGLAKMLGLRTHPTRSSSEWKYGNGN